MHNIFLTFILTAFKGLMDRLHRRTCLKTAKWSWQAMGWTLTSHLLAVTERAVPNSTALQWSSLTWRLSSDSSISHSAWTLQPKSSPGSKVGPFLRQEVQGWQRAAAADGSTSNRVALKPPGAGLSSQKVHSISLLGTTQLWREGSGSNGRRQCS